MIVQHFVLWCQTANATDRCTLVEILADAVMERRFSGPDGRQAEAALLLVLDDRSPKVRMALAAKVAASDKVPRQLVLGLADDIEPIACLVAGTSPLLGDRDLVDLAASGTSRLQSAIARRDAVSGALSAAIAAVGSREACLDLLLNEGAAITASVLRKLGRLYGSDARMRDALLGRAALPADTRQTLLLQLGHDLCTMPLVRQAVGPEGAQRVVFDACEQATLAIGERTAGDEIPSFVEHLRMSGQLSAAFLIRAVCAGNIDLFAAALVSLGGFSPKRVRAILVDAREPAFTSLVTACGLPEAVAPLLLSAVQVWKSLSAGESFAEPEDMPALVMERVVLSFRQRGDLEGFDRLEMLLHRLSSQTARVTARRRAERHLAA